MKTTNTKLLFHYILWTFLITYCSWGILILASQVEWLKFGSPLGMTLLTIGGNAPPIVAYFILRRQGKITGIKAYIKEAFAIKQPFHAYIVVFLLTATYFGIPALLGGITPNFPVYIAILSIPLMVIGGGLEELGWRFLLQPRLEKSLGFIKATLVTACIWSVWHLPLFFIKGTSQYNWNFGLFSIMIIGMSVALAVIYRMTQSIWLCILFHSVINAFLSSWEIDESLFIKLATSVGVTLVALSLLWIRRNKTGLTPKKSI
ncbi:membrane protease YdiL (CAAX protease family) [Paenibacillus turicensis]|uniref:Membrane protease YdiL (CAAX protease family) n=1 Tax=Paenibacillus turicensis TaxID=160487 RepID=A0ABS4FQD9_9BACL|nr:CPBP family intramembrane glutamic endopeptidase [Paenibacillus turicensis]MBP1904604.1 membrane protease YdiL (CAAX protease family) [Paenibacillus turicensis]